MSQFLGADDQDWSGVNESPTNLGPTIGSTRLTSPANRPVAVICPATPSGSFRSIEQRWPVSDARLGDWPGRLKLFRRRTIVVWKAGARTKPGSRSGARSPALP